VARMKSDLAAKPMRMEWPRPSPAPSIPPAANGGWLGWLARPLALLPPLALLACTADPIPNKQYDVNGSPERTTQPDRPAGCTGKTPLPAPVFDSYPNPTTQQLQPFRGNAPGADLITARGGKDATQPVSVGSDGRFCIEVSLTPNSLNAITFSTTDKVGCPGKETLVTVTHKSAPKVDGGSSAPINVAKGAAIISSATPDEGALAAVNDGDPATSAKFSFFDYTSGCDKNVWIRIDLGKVYQVSELKVRWATDAGSNYAACYALLLSSSASPGDPDPAQTATWTVAKQDQAAPAGDQNIAISPPTLARYAALLLYEDGSTDFYETFKVAELEVWGKDPTTTPPPEPDRCK
jgi:hypothetical protein